MVNIITKIKNSARLISQIMSSILFNSKLNNYLTGRIYKGDTKKICVPILNCSSCPGAIGSCPIGAMQSVFNSIKYNISYYVLGIVTMIGVLLGRFVCGYMCPFGLLQDILNKIPISNRRLPKWCKYIKYAVLIIFVFMLPILLKDSIGLGNPTFCKYICPAGTLGAGIPLVLLNKGLQRIIGVIFTLKISILVVIILLSVVYYRFFCKALCPLGAIYGLLNKVSFYHYKVDKTKCISCNKCINTCKMDVNILVNANSSECIRCGECKKACPTGAITSGFTKSKQKEITIPN